MNTNPMNTRTTLQRDLARLALGIENRRACARWRAAKATAASMIADAVGISRTDAILTLAARIYRNAPALVLV